MGKIIQNSNSSSHNIDKYNFLNLPLDGDASSPQRVTLEEPKPLMSEGSELDSSSLSPSSKDSLIESLLKKTDEMSSNFIKLQMKLEQMSEDHKSELARATQEAFANGLEAGKEEAKSDDEREVLQTIERLSSSVSMLEASSMQFESALVKMQQELSSVALDIAKEVISSEVSQNSTAIALRLAKNIIGELSDASSITLKVSPKDYKLLAHKLSELKKVKVEADKMVAEGGVIALSDTSNIDAQIIKRFEKVKKVALGE